MNPTDEQLRLRLHAAIDAYADDGSPALDPAALIASGTRLVRRRRLAVAGVVSATVGAVALAATAVVGPFDGASDVRPGGTTTGTVTSAPGPASATLTLPGSGVADGTEGTTFVVKVGPAALADDGAPVDQSREEVGYYVEDATGRPRLLAGASTEGLANRATLWHGGGDVVLGLVPADAAAVGLLPGRDGNTGGSSLDGPRRLPGTRWSAVAFRLDRVPAVGERDYAVVWWRTDGTPVTNDEVGSSVSFPASGEGISVWALPGQDAIGLRSRGGGSATLLSALGASSELDASTYREDATGTPSTLSGHLARVFVLRGAVTDVQATYAPGLTRARPVQVRRWPALDLTLVLAEADVSGTPVTAGHNPTLVSVLTWTDASGRTRTHRT